MIRSTGSEVAGQVGESLDELLEQRQRLAFDVRSDPSLRSDLEKVEGAIAEWERGQQRDALAEAEQQRREEAERERREEAERRRNEAKLKRLARAQIARLEECDELVGKLLPLLAEAAAAGDDVANVARGLGRPPEVYDIRRSLPVWLGHQLATVLPSTAFQVALDTRLRAPKLAELLAPTYSETEGGSS